MVFSIKKHLLRPNFLQKAKYSLYHSPIRRHESIEQSSELTKYNKFIYSKEFLYDLWKKNVKP